MIKSRTLHKMRQALGLVASVCACASVLAAQPANTLPTGGQVAAGQAAISQSGNTMTVNQASQRAVVNWDSYNVGSNAAVNYNQPNSQAVILNRVTSATASQIDGAIRANGTVIIANANGVTFGKGAEVNAGAMVATTMNQTDAEFMAGSNTWSGKGTGKVVNKGKIKVTDASGYVALLAPEVRNQGVILATVSASNAVVAGAGEKVTLNFSNNKLIGVTVDKAAVDALIENKRAIEVVGGVIALAAGSADQLMRSVINNTGRISASSMASSGGTVELMAATVNNNGTIAANANGQVGNGGAIKVVANNVNLGSKSDIQVNAKTNGDGGHIQIWANEQATVAGKLSATGGALSGNGGVIDTSAKQSVKFDPALKVDTSAKNGRYGQWIVDPLELTVDAAAANTISNALRTTNVTLDATGSACVGGLANCSSSQTPLINFLSGADIYSNNASTVLRVLAAGGTINVNNNIEVGQVYMEAATINVNAGGNINTTGGTGSNILLVGAQINILGGLGSNGQSTSGSSSAASVGSNRRRRGLDSGLSADDAAYTSSGGNILVLATGDITIGSSATLTANGQNGGTITIVSQAGAVTHSGVVDAVGTTGQGGQITLAGQAGTWLVGALSSVDGANAGGTLQIGIAQNMGSGTTLAPPAIGPPTDYFNSIPFSAITSGVTALDSQTGLTANASSAIGVPLHKAGQILVHGQTTLTTAATLQANADHGGSVAMASAGDYRNTGYIQTNGGAGLGGTIQIEADHIRLEAGSQIFATGTLGGGSVLIGGDWQGSGAMRQATSVFMHQDAKIDASATQKGDGGKVVLWSDIHHPHSVTSVHGAIHAQGGALGGHGGQVETSGHLLQVDGIAVNTVAPLGNAGQWLLDPYHIVINTGGAQYTNNSGTITDNNTCTTVGPNCSSYIDHTVIEAALANGNVTVQSSPGYNITIQGDGTVTTNSSNTLTYQSGGNIQFNYDSATYPGGVNGSNLNLVLQAVGTITANAPIAVKSVTASGVGFAGSGSIDMGLGGISINQTGNSTFSGVITGNAVLSKDGVGTLTLSGASTFLGGIVVNAGTLKLGANPRSSLGNGVQGGQVLGTTLESPLGLVGAITIQAGATLDTNGFNIGTVSSMNDPTIYMVGTSAVNQAKLINSSTAASTVYTNISLTNAATANAMTNVIAKADGSGTLKIAGSVSDGTGTNYAGLQIGDVGYAGQVILQSNNSFHGNVSVNYGTLQIGFWTSLGSGDVNVNAGAVLDLNGQSVAGTGTLTLNGTGINNGGALINTSVDPATYPGLIALAGNASVVGGTGTIELSATGTIIGSSFGLTLGGAQGGSLASIIGTGAGTVTKTGSGTWVLTGENTYSGATAIQAGTLRVGSATALGSDAVTVDSGAVLDLNGQTMTSTGTLTLNGTGIANGGALINSSATPATYAGLLALGSASSVVGDTGTIALTAMGTITGSGLGLTLGGAQGGSLASIIGTGTGTLTKVGSGTWTLSGSSTYTGNTTINSGVLSVSVLANGGSASGIGQSTNAASNLVINGGTLRYTGSGASTDRLFSMGGNGATLDASGTGSLSWTSTTGSIALTAATSPTLTLTGTGSGVLVAKLDNPATSGVAALTKTGTGTWRLSSTNPAYTGATSINEGVIQLGSTNAVPIASAITVNPNGTFDLNGIGMGKSFTLNGGTLTNSNTSTKATVTNNPAVTITLTADSKLMASPGAILTIGTGGSVAGGYAITIGKPGHTGVVEFAENNSYTGMTTVDYGTLKLVNNPKTWIPGALTVNANGIFDVFDYTFSKDITLNGGTLTGSSTSTNLRPTFTGVITLIADSKLAGNTLNKGVSIQNSIVGNFGITIGTNALNGIVTFTDLTAPKAYAYTGQTIVSNGTLAVYSNPASSSSLLRVDANGALYLMSTSTISKPITLNGGALISSVTTTFNGPITLTADSKIAAASTPTLTLGSNAVISGAYGLTYGLPTSSNYSGTSASYSGTVQVGSNSSYTGTTTVAYGILQLGAEGSGVNSPLGTADAGTVVAAGASLDLNGKTLVTAEPLTINGTGAGSNYVGALKNSVVANATYSGLLTLGSDSTITTYGRITISHTGQITGNGFTLTFKGGGEIASVIATGTGGLTMLSGGATLYLSGLNTYTGVTTIGAGILQVNSMADGGVASSIGQSSNAASNLVFSGGTMMYLGNINSSTDRLFTVTSSGSSSPWITTYNSGSLTFSNTGAITNSATSSNSLTLGSTNSNAPLIFKPIWGDPVSGTAGLTAGYGSTVLTGLNTYTGVTKVTASLSVSALSDGGVASNIGQSSNAASNLVLNGGTLLYTGSAASTDRLFTIDANSSINASGSGALAFTNSGAVVNSASSGTRTLTLTGTGSGTLSVAVPDGTGTGKTAIAKSGSGTWTLAGANTYTGNTTVSGGILRFAPSVFFYCGATQICDSANTNISSSPVGRGAVTITGGPTTGGTLDLNGNGVSSIYGRFYNPIVMGEPSTAAEVSVMNSNAVTSAGVFGAFTLSKISSTKTNLYSLKQVAGDANLIIGGVVSDTGPSGMQTGLKIGDVNNTGTVVLSGNNTFALFDSRHTLIDSGTLQISSDANLGAVPASAISNIKLTNGGTLLFSGQSASFTIHANRKILLDTGGGKIANNSVVYPATVAGLITGTTQLTIGSSGNTGTVVLSGQAVGSYTGTTNVVSGATLDLKYDGTVSFNSSSYTGAGTIVLEPVTAGGTIALGGSGSTLNLPLSLSSKFTDAATQVIVGGVSSSGSPNSGNLTVTGANTFVNSIYLLSGADVTINAAASVTTSKAAGNLVVAANGNFVNNAGANALSTTDAGSTDRWIVYTTLPATNYLGGLDSGKAAYWGSTYSTVAPSALGAGNRYVFSNGITISTTNASKRYGDTVDISSNFAVSGPLNPASYGNVFLGITDTDIFSTLPTISAASNANSDVNAPVGTYAMTASAAVTNPGYGITYASSGNGTLTVNPATVTLGMVASKTYDGSAVFNAGSVVVSGLANGDTLATATANSHKVTDNGSNYFVSFTLSSGTASNYVLVNGYNAAANSATINPLALTPIISAASSTYGSTVSPGTVTFSNKVSGDVVTASAVSIVAAQYSAANKLKAGSYAQSITSTLTGADAANYTLTGGFTTTTNNYTVNPLALSASIAAASSTYGSTVTLGAASFSNVVGSDSVTPSLVSIVSPAYSTSNNLSAGSYKQSITATLGGADADNYTLTGGFTTATNNYMVNPLALTGSIAAGSTTYGDTLVPGAVTWSNKVSGDVITPTVSVNTAGNTSTAGKLKAGSYTSIQGISALGGTDAANYSYGGVTGDYTVSPLALVASIASGSSTYGSAVTVGAASFSNVVGADVVTPSLVTIVSPAYSTSNNLSAGSYKQSITATLGGADADNYTLTGGFTTATNNYTVNPLALTGSIAAGSTTYGDTLVPGAVTWSNKVSGDVITPTVSVNTAGNTSTAGKLKAGSYTSIQGISALGGTDAANYSYGGVTGDYTVSPLALVASIASGSSTYGSAVTVGAASFSNVVGADVVTPSAVSVVSPITSTSGNLVAGSYKQSITATLGGADADNYTLTGGFTTATNNYTVNPLALTGSIAAGSTTYGDTLVPGAVTWTNKVSGDVITPTVSVNTAGNTSTAGKLKAGSYTSIQGISALGGTDAANYSYGGVTGDYTVSPLALVASIASGSSTYGSAVTVGAASFSNVVGADVVTPSAVSVVSPITSTSGHLVVGAYKQSIGASLGGADASNYVLTGGYTTATPNYLVSLLGLTIAGQTAVDRVYTGTTAAVINSATASLVGTVVGDDVSLNATGTFGTFASANVANGIAVTVAGNTLAGASAANYTLLQPTGLTANITPAPLTVTANFDSKIIGQSDVAGYQGVSYSGFVPLQSAANLGGTLAITRTNSSTNSAGVYTGVLQPSGLTSSNYTINYVNGDYTVVPADTLMVRSTNTSTTYGTAAAFAAPTVQYLNSTQNAILTLSQTSASGNTYTFSDGVGGSATFTLVATGPVSTSGQLVVGDYSITGQNFSKVSNNFTNAPVYSGVLSVTRKSVTASTSSVSKVYDGTTAMQGLTISLSGTVAGDQVTAGGTGAFAQANVGTNIGYSVSNLALSGNDSGNYVLTGGTTFSGSNGAITAAPLTVSGTKVYDGNGNFTYSQMTVAGAQNNETISLTAGNATTSSGNVNSYNGTSLSGLTINVSGGNALASNYSLPTTGNLSITQRQITVTADAQSTTYGTALGLGTTAYTVGGSGLVSGDEITAVTLQYNGNTTVPGTTNAATYSGGIVASGATGSGGFNTTNYAITYAPADLTVDKANLAVTATPSLSGNIYNGNAYTGSYTTTLLNGDTATVIGMATGTDVGTYASNLQINGAVLANYNTPVITNANLVISPKTITVSGQVANNKTYDGTTSATINSSSAGLNGVVNGDAVTLDASAASGVFASTNVANGIAVTVTGNTLGGVKAGNYTLLQPTGVTANITPATLTYTATAANSTYGSTPSVNAGTVTGFVNNETQASATTGTLVFTTTATSSSNVGSYGITGSGLTANNGNYTFVQAAGNSSALAISARPITVTADAQSTTYGTALGLGTSAYTLSSGTLASGDAISAVTLQYSGNATVPGTTSAGTYTNGIVPSGAVGTGGFNAINYAISYLPADLTVLPQPQPVPTGSSSAAVFRCSFSTQESDDDGVLNYSQCAVR